RQALTLLGILAQLLHERHVGIILVTLAADLDEWNDLVVAEPVGVLLQHTGEARAGARLHLAALHGEIERRRAGIAHDDPVPSAEDHIHGVGINEGAGADAGRPGDQLAAHDVIHALEAGGVPDPAEPVAAAGRAQPVEAAGGAAPAPAPR